MSVYGIVILGPSQHVWFNGVAKVLPKRDLVTTLKKIFLGQAIFRPINTSVFFSYNAALHGEDFGSVLARLRRDLLPTMRNSVVFWPACDFFIFTLICRYIFADILQSGLSSRGESSDIIRCSKMGPRWSGIAVVVKKFRRLKRRKGLRKLRHDVRSCEYEDVRVMWNILNGKEEDSSNWCSHSGARDSLFCGFVTWVRRVPGLCYWLR